MPNRTSPSAKARRRWRRMRWIAPCAAAVLAALAALNAYSQAYDRLPAADECNFLHEACWIAEHGGAAGFLGACFKGEYPFDNRNPALPLLGSTFAARDLASVRPFRLLQAALFWLALLAVYALAARASGRRTGLGLALLLGASHGWLHPGALIAAEPLVYAPLFAAWLLLSGTLRPRGRWAWAGAAAGLAWLLKATVSVLALAFAFALLRELLVRLWKKEPLREDLRAAPKALGLFAAGFVLAGLPLLWNNAARHGNPLHNRNARFAWLADYDERLLEGRGGAAEFLEAHGAEFALKRFAGGLPVAAEELVAAFRWPAWRYSVLLVPLLLLAALLGLLADPDRDRRAFALAFVLLTLALFAWWARFTSVLRFVAMLSPLLGWYALRGLGHFLRATRARELRARRERLRCGALGALALLAALALGLTLRVEGLGSPRAPLEPPPRFAYLHAWLLEHTVKRGAPTLVTSYFRPRNDVFWLLPPPYPAWLVPPFEDWPAFEAFAAERGARYLIVEPQTWQRREALLKPYVRDLGAGRLDFDLPGWKRVDADPEPPAPEFIVYERLP
ncbi:MAG: glycosyltransferase family 39 protein [Planctomycetota bacterium]|nr:glycosyltransferase family 39 protein [Planctomycetota bacterium]